MLQNILLEFLKAARLEQHAFKLVYKYPVNQKKRLFVSASMLEVTMKKF